MAETLESVKDRISAHYLGKSGIHAVGVRRSANSITVYVNPNKSAGFEQTLEALRKEAQPYAVITKPALEADFAQL